ncbi:hypothetical protein EOPP23_05560 [Endozoicomonas sp. OPT23]|uniref:Ig-like domain-containing protein n=1 Tax=Endozoicomonas sp. OPT23 TaxID=2072845 RepID=UPI00129B89BC|nr:Ig-like domain-containing protein [Endozoicomonas sp. OPT23]MRI32451.1 hypothetical protein [Endozoicomonas sp. OPT23]
MKRTVILLLGLLLTIKLSAAGHTVHILMSDKARSLLNNDSLQELLNANKNYWVVGSILPDGGYINHYSYAEPAHWPAFHVSYFTYIQEQCSGQLETKRCQQLFAHMLGMAAHGFEDECYDILLDDRAARVDPKERPGPLSARDTMVDKYAVYDYQNNWNLFPVAVTPAEDVFKVLSERMRVPNVELEHIKVGELTMISASSLERSIVGVASNYTDSMLYPWLRKTYITGPGGIDFSGNALVNLWGFYWNKFHGVSTAARPTVFPADGGYILPDKNDPWGRFTFISDRPLDTWSFYNNYTVVQEPLGIPVKGWIKQRSGYVVNFVPSQPLQVGETYKAVISSDVVDIWGEKIFEEDFSWTVTVQPEDSW